MKRYRDLSVGTKLSAGFGLALLFVMAVGLFGVAQLRGLNEVTSEVAGVWLPQVQVVGELKHNLAEYQLYATERVHLTATPGMVDPDEGMAREKREMLEGLRAYQIDAASPAERQLFDRFVGHLTAYQSSLSTLIRLLDAGEMLTANEQFEAVAIPEVTAAARQLDELLKLTNQNGTMVAAAAQQAYRMASWLTLGSTVFAAACLGALVGWIRQHVSKPVLAVSNAMHRLTQGDRSAPLALKYRWNDEIGKLYAAFASYRESLERSDELARIAELERQHLALAAANMPVGLCMFDAERRLVFCNQSYANFYSLPETLTRPGTPWLELMQFRIAAGHYVGLDSQRYLEQCVATIERGERIASLVELRDGRSIDLIHQPLPGGGWLATHHDVTDLRRSEARIAHMARHDGLTELPNRILFRERAEKALDEMGRQGAKVAFLCLDLDHFKTVNDTLGHPVGDALLKEVAARLKKVVREGDTVARLGGDEFVIVQAGSEQPVGATALAQRVIDALSAPYMMEGQGVVVISASVGISIAPGDGWQADQLLKNGDMALYRAKAEGRRTYRFFEPEMDARMQARRFLELDLREAVAGQQFEVYYQPVLNIGQGEVSSFEALLRWHHPRRGIVAPNEFIPLAEEIGLIVPIGEWVIKQACRDAADWPEGIKVAVNLSPVQFRNARLLAVITEALVESGLPASRLELEITETVLLADTEATLALLQQIHMLGVHIAMDDFGTGYSSLSYLRSFPFDKIKIDQSFVKDDGDTDSSVAIIRAVTSLGNSLGMLTTAEGVETAEQFERVRQEGVTEAQGFLLSEPLPAGEIPAMLGRVRSMVEGQSAAPALKTEPQARTNRLRRKLAG